MSLLLLIPAWWLVVAALGLAVCRAAARGDAAIARLRVEQPVAADLDHPLGHNRPSTGEMFNNLGG